MTRNVRDMRALARIVRENGAAMEEAVVRGLQSAGYRLEGMIPEAIATASPYPPEDTGDLSRSHYTTPTKQGALVGVDAPHAPFMEYGTRPHKPPLQPLADWAYRKGIVDAEIEVDELLAMDRGEWTDSEREAFGKVRAIAGKIAAKGIEPRHFMRDAVDRLLREGIIDEEIEAELKGIG